MPTASPQACFEINSPAVVSEVIDGEAIIMNLKSGNYFSIQRTGAAVWEWVNDGHPFEAVVELAQNRFSGEANEIEEALDEFLQTLLEHELIRPMNGSRPERTPVSADEIQTNDRPRFEKPEVQAFNDMKDLLLLDPIHDVDETGWPRMREDDQSETG